MINIRFNNSFARLIFIVICGIGAVILFAAKGFTAVFKTDKTLTKGTVPVDADVGTMQMAGLVEMTAFTMGIGQEQAN